MPRCRVIDPAFTWGDERAPRVPWDRTVIYEMHVRGYTKLHPSVPEELRGTYRGLTDPDVLDHISQDSASPRWSFCRSIPLLTTVI